MNILNNNTFIPRSTRTIAVCSILAFSAAVPATSFAGGYWSQNRGITKVSAKVESVKKNVVKKATAAPAKVKGKIEDVADKVQEIYEQIEENRPLMTQIKNGPLMSTIGDTLQFLQDNQADFQQFADQEAENFRDDIQNLLSDFLAITEDFPVARQKGKVAEQMQKALVLIDKLPAAFLYPMYKAVGPRLEEMQQTITNVRTKLAALPELPPMKELYLNPMDHAETMCTLVTDKKIAVHVATIQAMLASGVWSVKTVLEYLPKDLTVNAMVVGGGGTTVSAHPARMPLNIIVMIMEGINLSLTQNMAIGKSVCVASGLHTPS